MSDKYSTNMITPLQYMYIEDWFFCCDNSKRNLIVWYRTNWHSKTVRHWYMSDKYSTSMITLFKYIYRWLVFCCNINKRDLNVWYRTDWLSKILRHWYMSDCKEYTYTQMVTTGHNRTWARCIINGILNDSVVRLWVEDSMLI